MKIAVITDVHMSIRKASEVFLQSQLKFFRNQFIPDLKKRGISTIIIPGDFFDNRLALDSKILTHVLDLFENDLKDFDIHILVGNHDSYYESTIKVNSLRVLDFYKNVTIYEENKSIEMFGKKIYMCPWVTNYEDFLKNLETLPEHDICFGHFNFSNFMMFKDQEADHGLNPELFYKKFKLTISGHFHTRSEKEMNGNRIIYIGNPFHFTRNDIFDERGYSILDTETLELEFIENIESIRFVKYMYPKELNENDIKNNHVDIYIKYGEDYDERAVDEYINRLESFEPAFPINRKTINTFEIDSVEEQMKGTSTLELIKEWNETQSYENKEDVLKIVFELYEECKNIL